MKIAVISDIHGNMDAVKAVMDDIKNEHCDKLFVLGDYAMAGPEPQKTIKYFMDKQNDSNVEMIQGNTDAMIAGFSTDILNTLEKNAPVMASALQDDVKQLSTSEKRFLKNLPAQKQVNVDGISFLLVHGSPRKNNEDILAETPISEIEKMVQKVDAQVVLCGHTHVPCGFQTKSKKTVVNVGSIGRPFTEEAKSCYLIIDVVDGKCIFQHKFVNYCNKKASDKLKKRAFSGAELLANTLLNPTVRHF